MRFFSSAPKTGHRVTSSESMKHRQGFTSVGTESVGNFVSSDKPKALPVPKATQSSSKFKRLTDVIARIATSVSMHCYINVVQHLSDKGRYEYQLPRAYMELD